MTAFILKIIASVCMLLDHIWAVFTSSTPLYFTWIGRIAFPIYAYMIAQGCKHTNNINKYLLRLGIFALISEIPFDIAFMHYYTMDDTLNLGINFLRNTNVFYTLFLGVACISVYEKLKVKKRPELALISIVIIPFIFVGNVLPESFPVSTTEFAAIVTGLYTAAILCFVHFLPGIENENREPHNFLSFLAALPLLLTASMFASDYGAFGVALIFVLYLAKPEDKVRRTVVLAAGVIYHYGLDLFTSYSYYVDDVRVTSTMLNQSNLMSLLFAFIAVILIFLYNGKQGPKVKWAFYAFYPTHISALAIIWYLFAR